MCLTKLLGEIFSTVQGMFPDALWGAIDDVLASKHKHAVGLIIFPGNRSTVGKLTARFFDFNSTFNEWGHTAVYVRVAGKVTICLGFDPHRGKMVVYSITGKTKDIERGLISTPGQLYAEDSLISFPDAFAVEFPLALEDATRLSTSLLHYKVGEHGKYDTSLVGSSGPFEVDNLGNCIIFIRAVLKNTLGFDIHTQLTGQYGQSYPSIIGHNPFNLYDFGGKQGRLTPLARKDQLVLTTSKGIISGERVQKGTLAELTHNLTDTYMRTTFARVLLDGAIYIGGRLVNHFSPSVARTLSTKLGFLVPRLGTHHYLVAVCYLLLTLRTGIPFASNSRLWKLLYQVINASSIFHFLRYARSGDSSVLEIGAYEMGRTILYLMGTKALRLKFN